jgi:hypothetical protein
MISRNSAVYSPVRGAAHELAVNSRSMLQIMVTFSSYLDVPEAHLKVHGALPDFGRAAAESARKNARIHSAKERPANAFVAVPYRDYWFWIDDSDWQTKRALSAIIFIFTLTDTGGNERLPLITIPAQ